VAAIACKSSKPQCRTPRVLVIAGSRRSPVARKQNAAAARMAHVRRAPRPHAPVAQLDRASVYGTEGREFESLRARSESPAAAGLLLCLALGLRPKMSPICPEPSAGSAFDEITIGARVPGRAGSRPGLVREVPAELRCDARDVTLPATCSSPETAEVNAVCARLRQPLGLAERGPNG
jgi:hypothetical protein